MIATDDSSGYLTKQGIDIYESLWGLFFFALETVCIMKGCVIMNDGRFAVKHLNREDHAKIDKAAEWTRNRFPWLIKIIKLFIKD